tara:strand:+ start:65 stop:370 length:306 start_codon:yes stop_codon:yes gene_type:complete
MELWIFVALLLFLLIVSVYYNYKHGVLIIKTAEAIEDALDTLDEKYNSISGVLEIPLFYDSPQIRQVQTDIKHCRDSILEVASMLGNIEDQPGIEDEEKSS